MEYRNTDGKPLSVLGVGCYALSGAYGPKDPEAFGAMLRRAHELGVTYFDTADVYGSAEEVLGRAMEPFREKIWIATKAGAGEDGRPLTSAEHIRRSCEGSLRRLRTDAIDLYQIHYDDPSTPVDETLGALEALQQEGKILRYGVGHLPLEKVRAYFEKGRPFSELIELSPVSRRARQDLLPLCVKHGVGVVAFSVTGRGLLTGKFRPGHEFEENDIRRIDPLWQRERLASGQRVAERLAALASKYGKTPAQTAVAWTLAQPAVICALTGPSTIEHLEENLGGAGWTIADADLRSFDEFLRSEDERLLQEQLQAVHSILTQDLDPATAFRDLVYVLETLVEQAVASEEEILPLFQRLFGLRGHRFEEAGTRLREIQAEAQTAFAPRITERFEIRRRRVQQGD
ncbi:MAG: aldo/keto reductase [Candidatus Eisenbacteria bacterium]|nr:aldo/keto reductase [Candidatus Eisenbacteria bacterium]